VCSFEEFATHISHNKNSSSLTQQKLHPQQFHIHRGCIARLISAAFTPLAYSLTLDVVISVNAMWRIEARGMEGNDKIFSLEGKPSNPNAFFTTALGFWF